MDDGLEWMNKEVEDMKLKIKFLERAKEDLHTKQLYAEAYSRRENLKCFGLAERETKGDSDNTYNILFKFLKKNDLGFENLEKRIVLQKEIGKTHFWKNKTDYSNICGLQGSQDGIENFVSSSQPRD